MAPATTPTALAQTSGRCAICDQLSPWARSFAILRAEVGRRLADRDGADGLAGDAELGQVPAERQPIGDLSPRAAELIGVETHQDLLLEDLPVADPLVEDDAGRLVELLADKSRQAPLGTLDPQRPQSRVADRRQCLPPGLDDPDAGGQLRLPT